jgi:thiamine pyrophosphate-dependent acetolactate synthase large subunit-like protein
MGNFVVQNADLVLILGSRLNIRQVSYNWQSFARNAKKYGLILILRSSKNHLHLPI